MTQKEYSVAQMYWRVLGIHYFNIDDLPNFRRGQPTFLNKNWGDIVDNESSKLDPLSSDAFKKKYKLRMKLIQPQEKLL